AQRSADSKITRTIRRTNGYGWLWIWLRRAWLARLRIPTLNTRGHCDRRRKRSGPVDLTALSRLPQCITQQLEQPRFAPRKRKLPQLAPGGDQSAAQLVVG